jgi:hypothetical protein
MNNVRKECIDQSSFQSSDLGRAAFGVPIAQSLATYDWGGGRWRETPSFQTLRRRIRLLQRPALAWTSHYSVLRLISSGQRNTFGPWRSVGVVLPLSRRDRSAKSRSSGRRAGGSVAAAAFVTRAIGLRLSRGHQRADLACLPAIADVPEPRRRLADDQ